jgi:cell division protein FtsL
MRVPSLQSPKSTRAAALFIVLAAFGLIALGCTRVHQQHQIIKLGYELREAQRELQEKQEEHRRLSLEFAVLTNPARLEQLASSLGMVRPGPEQLREIPRKAEPSMFSQRQQSKQYWALAGEDSAK